MGGSGDDILYGARSAILDGGAGNNRLVIGDGPDENIFTLPTGDDGSISALQPGSRPQQVQFSRDGGVDLVTPPDQNLGNGQHDAFTVRMVEHDYSNLEVLRDNQDLVLAARDRDARMTIPDFFVAGSDHAGLQGILVETRVATLTDTATVAADNATELAARAVSRASASVGEVGTAAADSIVGAGGADHLQGLAGDDRLDGLSGDDTLDGGDGNDVLIGRSGNDVLRGEAGNDRIFGGYGDDSLEGGDGDDTLQEFAGVNVVDGGAGADTLRADGGTNVLRGGEGDDTIIAWEGDNRIEAGAGNDAVTLGSGTAVIDGGTGDDRITLAGTGSAALLFGRGSGVDRVGTSTTAWRSDSISEIRIGEGVDAADLRVAVSYNAGLQAEDLTISIVGAPDRLVLQGAVREGVSAVRNLRAFDGGGDSRRRSAGDAPCRHVR